MKVATRPKTGGRKKGTPNRITAEVRESFNELINNNLERLQADLDALEPLDRVKVILEMAKFVVPQLRAIDTKINADSDQIVIRPIFNLD